MSPEFQPEIPIFGAIVNTHSNNRGNEPVTWNQFHTFTNQVDTNFSIVNSKFVSLERQILELDSRFIAIEARFNEMESRFIRIEARFNEMNSRFIAIEARFNEIDKRFTELDAKIIALRGDFLEFKEEMRLIPVKIAGWVAGAMIGSCGVIFAGFQLLRGLL